MVACFVGKFLACDLPLDEVLHEVVWNPEVLLLGLCAHNAASVRLQVPSSEMYYL